MNQVPTSSNYCQVIPANNNLSLFKLRLLKQIIEHLKLKGCTTGFPSLGQRGSVLKNCTLLAPQVWPPGVIALVNNEASSAPVPDIQLRVSLTNCTCPSALGSFNMWNRTDRCSALLPHYWQGLTLYGWGEVSWFLKFPQFVLFQPFSMLQVKKCQTQQIRRKDKTIIL